MIPSKDLVKSPSVLHAKENCSSPSWRFEVVIEGAETPLQNLLNRFEKGIMDDVKSFVQRVAG